MTGNRGKVNHPAGLAANFRATAPTANEEDAPEMDELWEMAEKKFPGEMAELYKLLLSCIGQSGTAYESGNIPKSANDSFSPKATQFALLMNCLLDSDFYKRLKNGQVASYKKSVPNDPISQFKASHAILQDLFSFTEQIGLDWKLEAKDIKIASDTHTAYAIELKGTEIVDGVKKPFTETTSVTLCENPDAAQ